MRGFFSRVLLVALMTALLQPHHNIMATADSRESNSASQSNITYGCVGLHCLVADDLHANLFMDPHGLGAMLPALKKPPTLSTPKADQKVPSECPPNSLQGSSSCLASKQLQNGKCDPSNRDPYCQRTSGN